MKTARPNSHVASNALARVLTRRLASRPKADAPPMRASSAISPPISPQTMITQPMVSSRMTVRMTSVKLVSSSAGASMASPTTVPPTSGSMVRLESTASTSTTRVGIRTGNPSMVMGTGLWQCASNVQRHSETGQQPMAKVAGRAWTAWQPLARIPRRTGSS